MKHWEGCPGDDVRTDVEGEYCGTCGVRVGERVPVRRVVPPVPVVVPLRAAHGTYRYNRCEVCREAAGVTNPRPLSSKAVE